jgi:hypothetical protein
MFAPVNNPFNQFPSSSILKKMQFFEDQDGILKRYINEEGNWNSHLNNSKMFIQDCLNGKNIMSISILGSGWLLDVPVRFLAENFKEVIFYDLRHPKEIKHKYRNQSNFKFVELDITGGLIEQVFLFFSSRKRIDLFEMEHHLIVPSVILPFQSDFFISLNLLNQLDILIIDYIRKKTNLTDPFANKMRATIQKKHLELMQPGKSCMVTDFEEINLDFEDNIVLTKSLIYTPIMESLIQKKWIWHFDSQMTYHKNLKTNFNVMALKF